MAASSLALKIARNVVTIEQEAFEGLSAKDALQWIDDVGYMEWESDRLGQDLAHAYFALENIDPILVLLFFAHRLRSRVGRAALWVVGLAFVAAVASSRVDLGMHHVSDVVVGALNGVAAATLGWNYLRRRG